MSTEFAANIGQIASLLDKMEDEGRIDVSVIPKIEASEVIVKNLENQILSKEDIDVKASFLAFHILRNLSLTLEKMKSRFLKAPESHDNPSVAEDSIPLMPLLAESFDLASSLFVQRLSPKDEDFIIQKIQVLRGAIANSSMLASNLEERRGLSESGLSDEGKLLADAVQDIYTKE